MPTVTFPGLASGFNSKEYIDAVMKAERIPYNKLEEKKEITTAYKGVFDNLRTKLNKFKDAAADLKLAGSFTVNNATVSDATKMTVTAGESALAGSYAIKVGNLAKQGVYQSKVMQQNADISGLVGQKIQLKLSDSEITEIELTGANIDEVLNNLAKSINSNTKSGVSASIVQTSSTEKRLVLTSKETGAAHEINFMDPITNWSTLTPEDRKQVLQPTGDHPVIFMSSAVKSALGFDAADAHIQTASDAQLTINGVAVSSASNSIKDAIPGVTMQLTAIGDSTVKVSQDTDKIVGKVQAFVNAYNDIVKTIKANTPKSSKNSDGSLTLTLQGDSTLRSLRNELGSWMDSIVGNVQGFKLLSDIGLEVDKGVKTAADMTGEIKFDAELFKSKLAENPEAVQKMFTASTTNGDAVDGIGALFEKNLTPWTRSTDGYMASRITAYESDIKFITEQLDNMDLRLKKRQATLESKFVNMEKVMSGLNNQLTWIKGQVASLTKSSSSN
ncbi:flagellar filament capping protein FliD [Paenibacillus sanfengchensis]|uniref:flagellar filament capping protein FliD n=1 Tax=Paenibacillus sanfengchensis TaxID=3119819 RepID=UPI002FE17349